MSIKLGFAVLALLSPEPSGLSQLLPGDELRVREREPSFQGSAFTRAGVGLGRGANSNVLGLSRGLTRHNGSGSGIGGAGALRRCTTGNMEVGSGRRRISVFSCVPKEVHEGRCKRDNINRESIIKMDRLIRSNRL